MAEQENTTTTDVEGGKAGTSSREIDMTILDDKIKELGDMEKQLLLGDGKIGNKSNDTMMDEAYTKELKKAQNIKTKIQIVENLIMGVKTEGIFSLEKQRDDIDQEDKKNIDLIEKESQKLIKKYPEYAHSIESYIQNRFNKNQFYTHYYKKEHPEIIQTILKESYKNIDFSGLEKGIQAIQKSPHIFDKPAFLTYLIKNDITILEIEKKLSFLFGLEIVQEGFSDNESASNFKNTFGYGSIVEFIQMPKEQLFILNDFYKNDSKKELIGYIDSHLSLEQRDKIFAFEKIKNLYLDNKRLELGNNIEYSNDLLMSFSNIKDLKLKEKMKRIMNSYIKNSSESKEITSFFNENGEFDDLVKNSNLSDRYFALDVFYKLIYNIDGTNICIPFHAEIQDKISEKMQKYQQEEENNIKQAIGNLTDKYKTNPVILHQIEKSLKTVQGPSDYLHILEKYSNLPEHSQTIRPENKDKKETPLVNTNELQQAQKSLSKLGWNLKIDSDGKLIGQNGEKSFKQTIGNRTAEIGNDGKIFIQGAFGYKFKYDNNLDGIEKYLEIADNIEYIDNMGLGHFGDHFKDMINIFNNLSHLTGLKQIKIDDTSLNSNNFINQVELNNLTMAFHKIGFLENSSYSYGFQNGTMETTIFNHKLETNFKGRNFFQGGELNSELFRDIIRKTDWNKV